MKMRERTVTNVFDLKVATVEIEKLVHTYVGNEASELRKMHGDLLANELELTVASLFLARIIAKQHMLSGEGLASLRNRAIESCEYATRVFINKSMSKLEV